MISSYQDIIQQQRDFFSSGVTLTLDFRIKQLQLLKSALLSSIDRIKQALHQDLGRCDFEVNFDLGVIDTIDYFIDNLGSWVVKKKVTASPRQQPAEVYIEPIPLGSCLIISPWNYPIELTIAPLLGAISGGNTAIIKTSEYSEHCSAVLADIINNTFPMSYLHVLGGDASVAQNLLEHKFDHVFYTGGTAVGRKVYQAASKYLTPVVLELGGKSPCIIDDTVDYKQAARRILFGKTINCGQTCIAPDYCLVSANAYNQMLLAFREVLQEFYPQGAIGHKDFSKIISKKHLSRLEQLLRGQKRDNIVVGGEVDNNSQQISPCLLSFKQIEDALANPIMQEEIFGPILPIIKYDRLEQIWQVIATASQPLALYIFSQDQEFCQTVMNKIPSGGVAINDVMVHIMNIECGFGGIGNSGLGAYHGQLSFKTYSHYRTVAVRAFNIDDPLNDRFPPH